MHGVMVGLQPMNIYDIRQEKSERRMSNETVERYEARLVDAAKRYASYDRSDPFCMDRCCGHIRQGLCKAVEQSDGLPWPAADTTIKGDAGAPGHYDALILTTMHDGAIELMYKNLRRP